MDQQQPTQVIVSTPEVTWSVKEVFSDLKGDLVKHLDKQDRVLEAIDRRLDNTATKDDIREVHDRISKVEERIVPLEQQESDEKAIQINRGRYRTTVQWGIGILASCAIIATLLVTIIFH